MYQNKTKLSKEAKKQLSRLREDFKSRVVENVEWLRTPEGADYKDDEEIVKLALRQNGLLFEVISRRLKDKKSIALNAVKQNGMALVHLSNEQKKDKEILHEAVRSKGSAIQYITNPDLIDYDLAITAVKSEANVFRVLPIAYKDNLRIAKIAVEKNGFLFLEASENLRDNFELAKVAVNVNYRSLEGVSPSLQRNPSLLLDVLAQNPVYFGDFLKDTLKNDPIIIKCLHRALKKQSKGFLTKTLMNLDKFDKCTITNIADKEWVFFRKDNPSILDIAPEGASDKVISLLVSAVPKELLNLPFKSFRLMNEVHIEKRFRKNAEEQKKALIEARKFKKRSQKQ